MATATEVINRLAARGVTFDDVPVSRGLPEKEKLISSPLHPSETPVDVLTGQAPSMDGVEEPAGGQSTPPVNTPSTLPVDGDVDGDVDGSIPPDGDGVNSQSTRQHDIRQDEDVEFYFSAIDEPLDLGDGGQDSPTVQPAAATPPASTPPPPLGKPPKLSRDAKQLARLLVHYRGFEQAERLARRLRWEGTIGDARVLAAAYELEKAGLAVVSNSSVKLRRIGEVRPGVSTHEIPPQNDCKRANALPAADYTDAPLAADDFEEGTL